MSTGAPIRKSRFKPDEVEKVKETLLAIRRTYGSSIVRFVWNRIQQETKLREKLERQKFQAERGLEDLKRRFGS